MSNSTITRAAKIAESLRSLQPGKRQLSSTSPDFELAQALLWAPDQLERRTIDLQGVQSVTRVNIGGQGEAVFAFSEKSNKDLVNGAALYAYHASIEWGMVANQQALTIFNSHWVKQKAWYELVSIPWERIESGLDIFEGLTPEGLTYGLIERVAGRFARPDEQLQPVDDALVSRLDFWRSEIARYSPDLKRTDELIHRLFAQLFVLRAVEDRKLAKGLGSLSDCREEKKRLVNRTLLKQIFVFARTHLQSELFEVDLIDQIPDPVLYGVIDDLYFPEHLPSANARYNFAWIDADVLGRAYEKYLSQILQSTSGGPQLELLQTQQPLRDIQRFRNRRGAGIYYTPQFLVSYLVRECIDRHLAQAKAIPPRIVDPSCGSGSFLTASVSYLIQKLRSSDGAKNWGRQLVTQRLICGIDSDPRAVLLAKLSLWLRLAEEPDPLPLPALNDVIIEGDSLSSQVWQKLPTEFDIVLGNPPFVPTGSIPSRQQLELEFETARGRFDYSYLFVETAIKKLRPNGYLGMVVPNRLFRNRDAGSVRDFLTKSSILELITDFGSNEVFRGVSAYIGTIIAVKRNGGPDRPLNYVRILTISPRLMNLILEAAARAEIRNDFVLSFQERQPIGQNPWLFLSPATRSARIRLEDASVLLSEVAEVFQGIKAGANDLFILHVTMDPSGPTISVQNGLGDVHIIESDLLHPVVYGAQIEPYKRVTSPSYILYPYINGTVIDERQLSTKYPLTYRYLSAYRTLLERRTSVVASGRQWFELVRHRDQSKLQRPKLLMRDLAITTAFALDENGSTFLVGGTAVVPNDTGILKPLLAYLNSVLANWYLGPMTPSFRADFQKFEPQHLSPIPILRQVVEDEKVQRDLSTLVDIVLLNQESGNVGLAEKACKEIDRLLCSIIGVDPGA